MIQAIVFDFDGVMVDSEPLHYQAFMQVGQSFGAQFSYEHYLEHYIGYDDRDAFRVMLREVEQDPQEPGRVATLCEQKQQAFDAIVAQHAQASAEGGSVATSSIAIPGSVELVDECVNAGLPIAIASGATRADIDLMLNILGRTDAFPIIISADDVSRSKPDPSSYVKAAEQLGIDPQYCLAIEDTAAGLASAKGAGMMTLALSTTSPAEHLQKADRVIPNLKGIDLNRLRKWFD
jgi:beta-phosphoglucomutase-like phosphatase (HAD superfamily)